MRNFDFLGFTFRPRKVITRKGVHFCSFSPAISNDAVQKIRAEIRSWNLHRRTAETIGDLAVVLVKFCHDPLEFFDQLRIPAQVVH